MSIVTPCLDAAAFLGEAVESVLAQTYPNWEMIIVDDGSADGSPAIARHYARREPRKIRVLRHEGGASRGKAVSRNLGIEHAQGRFLAFLDADDVYLPGKLAWQVPIAEAHPDVALVYGPTRYWRSWENQALQDVVAPIGLAARTVHEPPTVLTAFLRDGGIVPCTCGLLARLDVVRRLGAFDLSVDHLFEDQVLIAKLCLASRVYVDDVCHDLYRQHPGSTSALAERAGRYHPTRPNAARFEYLSWLEGYATDTGVEDEAFWTALRHAFMPYRRPWAAGMVQIRDAAVHAAQLVTTLVRTMRTAAGGERLCRRGDGPASSRWSCRAGCIASSAAASWASPTGLLSASSTSAAFAVSRRSAGSSATTGASP
ncbi:MAG TPA: glycosyltransferase [Streptosporangiaceae bacterium]